MGVFIMNLIVLAGGLSTERDVSFKSGSMVCKALRSKGHRVILLDVFLGVGEEGEDLSDAFERTHELSYDAGDIPDTAPDIPAVIASRKDSSPCFFGPNVIALCRMADMVFMALHGADGENGRVQAAFDLYGIRYTGNGYLSSAIAMNKSIAKEYLKNFDIPCPKGFSVKKNQLPDSVSETISYPCVVKPVCGGSSIGVTIVNSSGEFDAALTEAFRWDDEVIVEDYIQGREFSVGVMDGIALPVIEIVPKKGFYDFKNKYAAGSTVETCPAEISDTIAARMQLYAERICAVLAMDTYARMDFLLQEKTDEIYFLEANTLPGMTPTSLLPQEAAVLGVDYAELCQKILDLSLKKYMNA